jgi:hypothetical protein
LAAATAKSPDLKKTPIFDLSGLQDKNDSSQLLVWKQFLSTPLIVPFPITAHCEKWRKWGERKFILPQFFELFYLKSIA